MRGTGIVRVLGLMAALAGCSAETAEPQAEQPAPPGSQTPPPAGTTPTPVPTTPPAPPNKVVTTVRVHYPAGSRSLAIRGSTGTLDWNRGVALKQVEKDVWSWTSETLDTPLEWKPLLDDSTWSRGPNYKVKPGETVDVYPHFVKTSGTVTRKWPSFTSQVLPSTRSVWVYVPPTYDENTTAKFPVVYMHDGQNLFDPSTAFGGNEWKVDEAMNAGAEDGTIREAIVVGIANTSARIDELTPTADSRYGGGKADLYLRMITDELKPLVDRELRTLTGREDTAIAGSSLGGLCSSYASVRRADVFGMAGVFSPSTWWDNRVILGEVATIPQKPAKPIRVYVDSGDAGTSGDGVTDTKELAAKYRAAGYTDDVTLRYVVQPGGQHNEIYWAQRFPAAMRFVLGPRAN
jgi:predicted alpha/beta superfamily hydrolase